MERHGRTPEELARGMAKHMTINAAIKRVAGHIYNDHDNTEFFSHVLVELHNLNKDTTQPKTNKGRTIESFFEMELKVSCKTTKVDTNAAETLSRNSGCTLIEALKVLGVKFDND